MASQTSGCEIICCSCSRLIGASCEYIVHLPTPQSWITSHTGGQCLLSYRFKDCLGTRIVSIVSSLSYHTMLQPHPNTVILSLSLYWFDFASQSSDLLAFTSESQMFCINSTREFASWFHFCKTATSDELIGGHELRNRSIS